eukprot:477995-Pelagomonas_calceolata.AAC.8
MNQERFGAFKPFRLLPQQVPVPDTMSTLQRAAADRRCTPPLECATTTHMQAHLNNTVFCTVPKHCQKCQCCRWRCLTYCAQGRLWTADQPA